MPKGSTAAEKVRRIRTRSALCFASCFIGWTVVVGSVGDIGYEQFRRWQFTVRRDAVESPQTPDDKLLTERKWFEEYRRSWRGFGLAPSANDADKLITQIDTIRNDRFWSPVVKAKDDAESANAAGIYLKTLPNGRHVPEVREKVERQKIADARQENDAWLTRRTDDLRVATDPDLKKLELLHHELAEGLPHREVATPDQSARWDKLLRDCGDRLARGVADLERERFLRAYTGALKQNDPVTAAMFLSEYSQRDENWWKRLVEEFPGEVATRARDVTEKVIKDHQFPAVKDAVNHAQESLRHLEWSLRPTEPKLADRVLQGQRDIKTLQDMVSEKEDQHYYARVLRQRDQASCQEYLDPIKPGAMGDAVKAYLTYLERMESPLKLSVAVKIFWDKKYGDTGDDHVLTVRSDDRVVLRVTKLQSTPGELSGEVGRFPMNGLKLSQSIRVRAEIIEEDPFFNDDAGEGETTFKLSALRSEMNVKLKPHDGSSFANELRLTIVDGVPPEPELPKWKSR